MTGQALTPLALAEQSGDVRLRRALDVHDRKAVGRPDLVALIRSLAVRQGYVSVEVPEGGGWPVTDDWRAASCLVEEAGGCSVVTPQPWFPTWGDTRAAPDVDASSLAIRQAPVAVAGDPFLSGASGGPATYRTAGQREAVRAVLAAAPGDSVLAVLPTGSGKTMVATVPAFLARPDVTVIVVPTTSLALDLERRLQTDYGLSHPIAYHGGLASEDKESLRRRLREREQWIVVTSPEAATMSLAPTLSTLAGEGRLRHLVIDEAHIVSAWGGAFRPEFQAIAGLRRQLRQAARTARTDFTTVLLTGTLDDHGLALLEHFFSDEGLTLVAAPSTRPEPAYWSVAAGDEDDKREVLLDAVRHLPRPLLIYTSLVESEQSSNARDVAHWLRLAGFRRVRRVTGGASITARQEAVRAVRCDGEIDDDCDIVVGSSAFGLGVDIDDVRCVLHLCIPESLDRYYQEVGRSGRDGRAAVSLVVHSPPDRLVAKKLAAPGNIGLVKSWRHWTAMRDGGIDRDGTLQVSLTSATADVTAPASDANKQWNLHTLTLMELAGMIRLRWRPPIEQHDFATDDAEREYFESLFSQLRVEVKQGDLQESIFKQRISRVRQEGGTAAATGLQRVERLIDGQPRCHNAVFADAYTLHLSNGDVVHPARQCGGCPACRIGGRHPRTPSGPPVAPYVHGPALDVPPRLSRLLDRGPQLSVAYAGRLDRHSDMLEALIRRLLEGGVRLVVAADPGESGIREAMGRARVDWYSTEPLHAWLKRHMPARLVTLVLLPPKQSVADVEQLLKVRDEGIPCIVVHEATQAGPPWSKLLLREEVGNWLDLPAALGRI